MTDYSSRMITFLNLNLHLLISYFKAFSIQYLNHTLPQKTKSEFRTDSKISRGTKKTHLNSHTVFLYVIEIYVSSLTIASIGKGAQGLVGG